MRRSCGFHAQRAFLFVGNKDGLTRRQAARLFADHLRRAVWP